MVFYDNIMKYQVKTGDQIHFKLRMIEVNPGPDRQNNPVHIQVRKYKREIKKTTLNKKQTINQSKKEII